MRLLHFFKGHQSLAAIVALPIVIVVACAAPPASPATAGSASGAAATSAVTPSSPPRYSAYSVTAATVQPAGSILVTMSNFVFTPATLALPAGKIVLYLVNVSDEPHNFSLREPSRPLFNVVALTESIEPGKAAVLTIDALSAGVYHATCAISDHASRGMVADLTTK